MLTKPRPDDSLSLASPFLCQRGKLYCPLCELFPPKSVVLLPPNGEILLMKSLSQISPAEKFLNNGRSVGRQAHTTAIVASSSVQYSVGATLSCFCQHLRPWESCSAWVSPTRYTLCLKSISGLIEEVDARNADADHTGHDINKQKQTFPVQPVDLQSSKEKEEADDDLLSGGHLQTPRHGQWNRQDKNVHAHVGDGGGNKHIKILVAMCVMLGRPIHGFPDLIDGHALKECGEKERNSPSADGNEEHKSNNRKDWTSENPAIE